MKEILIALFLSFALVFISCNSSENDSQENNESKIEKDVADAAESFRPSVNIEYLEDFLTFQTHEDIESFFGSENVEKTKILKEEGTVFYPISILNPQNRNRVFIYWKDEDYKNPIFVEAYYSYYSHEFVVLTDEGDTYTTKDGIAIGTKIPELEKIIGEFSFYGLAWDMGGLVFGHNKKYSNYKISLGYLAEDWPNELYKISGDREFKSDNEIARRNQLEVVSIKYFPE